MKYALINSEQTVENVIVGGEDYENPDYDVLDVQGRDIQPNDYYDAESDEFVTPRLTIEAPDTIANDGTAKEITIETTARSDQPATLSVGDYSEEIKVPTDSSYIDQITTIAAAGTAIEVVAEPDTDVRRETAEIEVVEA